MDLKKVSTEKMEAELLRRYKGWAAESKTSFTLHVVEYITSAMAQRRAGEPLRPGWRTRFELQIKKDLLR